MASPISKIFRRPAREPSSASTPTAKAMSVAAGMAQPRRRRVARLMAGIDRGRHGHAAHRREPGNATFGRADSSPSTNSCLISSPTRRKNMAISPSLIQSSSGLSSSEGADTDT